ncbi:MAG: hypothetical protein ACOX4I_08640 [Anaerovoracaceae bacterium]
MDRLTTEQSDFLKRLKTESVRFESLPAEEKEIARYLNELGYVSTTRISRSESDGSVFRSWNDIDTVSISEEGRIYLINEKISVDEYLLLKNQMLSLKTMAETAASDSKTSKKDARFSKIISVLAIIISIAAIIVPVLMQVL